MTDQELKDLVASLAVSQDRTDAQMARTDAQIARTEAQMARTEAQMAKTDAKLNRVAEQLGHIGNNQGAVAEEFFLNSLRAKPELGGIVYDVVAHGETRSRRGVQDEFDLILVNGAHVALIEVKYKAHDKDLRKLITQKAVHFRLLYAEFAHLTLHLGLASFHMHDELRQSALEQGVMALQRKGDVVLTHLPTLSADLNLPA